MRRNRRSRRRVRVSRWLVINRSRGGMSITLGAVGRRLTIGHQGLTWRLGWPGSGFAATGRRSWRRLWCDLGRWVGRQPFGASTCAARRRNRGKR